MALELHNFVWEGERLVQVETQPHHIAGVLAKIRNTLENSDCEWEDIYSAYYKCEEDSTITFYEGESAEAGSPGIWTYVVYDCAVGEEEVVTNLNINTLAPVLELQQLVENLKDSSKLIPNAENAVVDIRKLRDYCLNPEHDEGKHKARLFSSILSMTADNAEELRQILLKVVKTHKARLGRRDEFGQRYILDFTLEWQDRSATIRSAWIIEHSSDLPRLTTCYPL